MKKAVLILVAALVLSPAFAAAQTSQGSGAGSGSGSGSGAGQATTQKDPTRATTAVAAKIEEAQRRFVQTLTNVQIELTLTDHTGGAPAEKKTVSMIVASGSWGKIRSAGNVRPVNEAPLIVDLNVDARPFVSVDGLIQLELTLNYTPPGAAPKEKEDFKTGRPTGVNQSQTVILTSGKPLIISQAADPLSDRKVVVEVKATVLK